MRFYSMILIHRLVSDPIQSPLFLDIWLQSWFPISFSFSFVCVHNYAITNIQSQHHNKYRIKPSGYSVFNVCTLESRYMNRHTMLIVENEHKTFEPNQNIKTQISNTRLNKTELHEQIKANDVSSIDWIPILYLRWIEIFSNKVCLCNASTKSD